jgi:transcriptional regulator with XRE-family HTH domain
MTKPNEKLQRARLEKRWSVAVASRKVGVSINTFNRWERGLQIPQLATLGQLMEAFEMSAEDLGFGYVVSPHGYRVFLSHKGKHEMPRAEEVEEDTVHSTASAISGAILGTSVPGVSYSAKSSRAPHVQPAGQAQIEEERFSRRQVIAALIGTPAAVFCTRQGDTLSLLRVEEILTLCASHIPLCWQLYFEGGQAEVERVLPDYITQLSTLARHPSSYQRRAAALLSQVYQLASLLATQRQDYGAASTAARQGLLYGELAGDPGLQVASHIRQALVYFYLKRPRQRLQAYQNALLLAPSTSPLLQGRTYVGMVEVCSKLGQESEARHFLELARQTFPQRAEDDPNYSYTHFSTTSLSAFEGMMYLNLDQPDKAWQSFQHIDRLVPADPVPNRLELTVNQAAATCALGELEQTCQYLGIAVPMARELGSHLRIDTAYEIYERMVDKWGDERPVKELEELFR